MKFTSNQIITIVIAFLIGVVVASALRGGDQPEDKMEGDAAAMEESGESMDAQPETSAPAATAPAPTTSAPAQEPVVGNDFVSGTCNTGLSAKVDNRLNAVILNWQPCASQDFQLYKLVKSQTNSNPVYPGDPVAFQSSNKNAANFVDKTVAPRTTYHYRMCVVQRLNKINCSNVATVSL